MLTDNEGNAESGAQGTVRVPPYTVLAAAYDAVMEHVDYAQWAGYIHDLFRKHHGAVRSVLELACGTGSLALKLQPMGAYRYMATDVSEYMVRVAEAKKARTNAEVVFEVADATTIEVDKAYDAVVMVYDSLNYLLEASSVSACLVQSRKALAPGGLAIIDQSTPANSENNAHDFEDRGAGQGFRFVRTSDYNPVTRLHRTVLDIVVDGTAYREEHTERAYDREEMTTLITAAGFEVAAAYDGFTRAPAHGGSERIHWVLRNPAGS